MNQRLGIAAALLGDPEVLLLDEPVNGLDPEGIIWIRTLLRDLAAEGRTVLLSSHLMSEMAMTAQRLIVIGRGKLIADTDIDDFLRRSSGNFVRVRSPEPERLRALLTPLAESRRGGRRRRPPGWRPRLSRGRRRRVRRGHQGARAHGRAGIARRGLPRAHPGQRRVPPRRLPDSSCTRPSPIPLPEETSRDRAHRPADQTHRHRPEGPTRPAARRRHPHVGGDQVPLGPVDLVDAALRVRDDDRLRGAVLLRLRQPLRPARPPRAPSSTPRCTASAGSSWPSWPSASSAC